jgi:hypothetical protein
MKKSSSTKQPLLNHELTPTSLPLEVRQVSLSPVGTGSGSGLREGVQALPPSVTSLALLPDLAAAEREGGGAGGAWRLRLGPVSPLAMWRSVPAVLELCAAFDRPGLPCNLDGCVPRVELRFKAPDGPGALGTYLGQCADLAGRLRSGGAPSGVELALDVAGPAAVAVEAAGNGGEGSFLGRVLGAVLPAVAPHLASLDLAASGGPLPTGFSRHLTAPGLAFPLLTSLTLDSFGKLEPPSYSPSHLMEAADVAALANLVAPRLCHVVLLCPAGVKNRGGGTICGGSSTAAIKALAMGLARPVDASGRPSGLELLVGIRPTEEGDEEGLERALAAAGRDWVDVVWPRDDYDDGGYSGPESD